MSTRTPSTAPTSRSHAATRAGPRRAPGANRGRAARPATDTASGNTADQGEGQRDRSAECGRHQPGAELRQPAPPPARRRGARAGARPAAAPASRTRTWSAPSRRASHSSDRPGPDRPAPVQRGLPRGDQPDRHATTAAVSASSAPDGGRSPPATAGRPPACQAVPATLAMTTTPTSAASSPNRATRQGVGHHHREPEPSRLVSRDSPASAAAPRLLARPPVDTACRHRPAAAARSSQAAATPA